MVILDTDVIIELLKGNIETKKNIDIIGHQNIAITSITVMELYYGSFNKKELQQIKKSLSNFYILKISESVSDISTKLIETYSKSHNLAIPDSLIAGIALDKGLSLFTYNVKDYSFIDNLVLYKLQSTD